MKFKLNVDPLAEECVTATVREPSPLTDEIEGLVLRYTGMDRITVQDEDSIGEITFAAIECIIVEGGKTYVIDENGKKRRIRERLCRVEEILPSCFMRIHKSAIANRRRIKRFVTAYSGAVDAEFFSGHREYVSRRCFAEIKRRLMKK